jgi:Flagellar basal body-associated protein
MENKKEKKGSSKIKIILIAVVATLVVGAGAYFGYTMFLKDKGQTTKTAAHTTQQVVVQQTQQQAGATGQQVSLVQPVVSTKTFGLDEFLVNLADEDGKRYLKVKVFLGYDNKKLDAELEEKKPILRDAIISVLRTKKAADITPKGVESVKIEIIQRINLMLEKGQLNNVYINDILVQ